MNSIETEIRSSVVRPKPAALNRRPSSPDIPIRVWLVDDQEPLRLLLAELLRRFDSVYCDRQFSSAEALLEQLRPENAPDVLLMDVQMPGMGGLDAIEKVAAAAPRTRVIMMTTFYDAERAARARQNGAFAFLVKTTPIDSVVEQICKAAAAPVPMRAAVPVCEQQPEQSESLLPRAMNLLRNLIVGDRCEAS
jgi:DNA-binding NarL/FixJ family response regulator